MLSEFTGVSEEEIREVVARHRHEPSYRPIVVITMRRSIRLPR